MEIYERIRLLRKEYLKLSQEKFGEKLGVSRTVIKNIELDNLKRSEQKEPLYKLICKEFNVRYEWLMAGDGEMFNETQEEFLDKLAEQYGLRPNARKILDFYDSLEDSQKQTLENLIYQAAKCVLEDNIAQARDNIIEKATVANNFDLARAAISIFDKAFRYVGVGNLSEDEINKLTWVNGEAADKTVLSHSTKSKAQNNISNDIKKTMEKESYISPKNTSKK